MMVRADRIFLKAVHKTDAESSHCCMSETYHVFEHRQLSVTAFDLHNRQISCAIKMEQQMIETMQGLSTLSRTGIQCGVLILETKNDSLSMTGQGLLALASAMNEPDILTSPR